MQAVGSGMDCGGSKSRNREPIRSLLQKSEKRMIMTVVKMVKIEKVMISAGKTAHELVCKGNVHVTLKFVVFFIHLFNKYF